MLTNEKRLLAAGLFGGFAMAATVFAVLPTIAAEEGRNTGIPAQDEPESRAKATPGTVYAVVASNGNLARGDGAVRVDRGRYRGDYIVHFNRNVTGCAYNATIGLPGRTDVSAPGFITVVGSNASNKAVFVSTYGLNAASAARGFHLTVTCG
jgi:hypothetical protein